MNLNHSKLLKNLALIGAALTLVHCGSKGYDNYQMGSQENSTGHQAEMGEDYVTGNEDRLVLEKAVIAPSNPELPSSEEKRTLEFNQSLKDFVFLRYDQASTKPARLGNDSYTFQLLVRGQWISFSGSLSKEGTKRVLSESQSKEDSSFSMKGDFEDFENHVAGRFVVSKNGLKATVLYRAYKAEMKVNLPSDKDITQHQNLKRKVDRLETANYAWVNTFAIPFGVSTYDIAIVRTSVANKEDDIPLEFRGESIRTLNVVGVKAQIKNSSKDQDLDSISLIGNAEGEDSKIFAVKVKDDKGEDTEILVDIERKKTEEELNAEKKKEEDLLKKLYEPADEDSPLSHLPPDEDIPKPTPNPRLEHKKNKTETETPPRQNTTTGTNIGNNKNSYLIASGANALKIIKDFETNFTLSGVQKEINAIKKSKAEREKLKSFFKFANPFRGLIENIASAYSVPAQYAYVSLIESAYFYGGHYKIQVAPSSTATGPFQIIYGTAASLGMKVFSNSKGVLPSVSDERRYFAPSACGAAKYFRNNAKMFPRDTTLAILAYNQGEGYALKMAKNYGYDYSRIAKNNIKGVQYSNQKLAAYFIAGAYQGSQFDVDSSSPKSLPSKSVFPNAAIKDKVCAEAVSSGS